MAARRSPSTPLASLGRSASPSSSIVSTDAAATAPQPDPEELEPPITRMLDQTYASCELPGEWSRWNTFFEDEQTQNSGTLRSKLKKSCAFSIETLFRNMMIVSEYKEFQLDGAIGEILPLSMPIPQFTAVHSALRLVRNLSIEEEDVRVQFTSWNVQHLYSALSAAQQQTGFVVARQTPNAIYLTSTAQHVDESSAGAGAGAGTGSLPGTGAGALPGAGTADGTTEDDIVTHVIIKAQLGPYSLSDILRSRRCYWAGSSSKDLAVAMKLLYHHVSQARIDDSGASFKSEMAQVDDSIKFLYLTVKHMSDRYTIKSIKCISPTMAESVDGTSEPDSIPALSAGIVANVKWLKPTSYVRWKLESFDTGHVLCDLFRHYKVSLDLEYKFYCDQHARPAWIDDTMFMRSMQVQERVLALAGLMARRYQSSPRTFASNMRATAKANVKPMDLNETIRTLSQLDLRRGPGSYSSILRVPPSVVEPTYELSRLPVLHSTWHTFLNALSFLRGTLEPHRH